MSNIEKTIAALNKSNFKAVYAKNAGQAREIVLSLIKKDDTVGFGGSVTLDETGILDAIVDRGHEVYSTVIANRRSQDKNESKRMGMNADVYVTGTNAVTLAGDLINIDGSGNRVAAMTFGPEKVIVVMGKNKITDNPHTAIARIKKHACGKNARRLNLNTPCAIDDLCTDCDSPQRMCNVTMRTQCPPHGTEIHVILIDEDFGY